MINQFSRTELLIKKEGINKLHNATVAIFGIGGVGSYVVEGLARAGIGHFVLIDADKICLTNINRQIIATRKTIGKFKVNVAKERILEINPNATVETFQEFYMPDSKTNIITKNLDYVIDCVDTIAAKIAIIEQCKKLQIPVISAMGTANKMDPSKFEIADIYKTSICPLAKIIRKELRKKNIDNLKVIYSKEEPIKINESDKDNLEEDCIYPNHILGSISFVPSVAGLMIAGEVVREIINLELIG